MPSTIGGEKIIGKKSLQKKGNREQQNLELPISSLQAIDFKHSAS